MSAPELSTLWRSPVRAWLEVAGTAIAPALGSENIEVKDTTIQLHYQGSNPKLDAIFMRRQFRVCSHADTTILEATPYSCIGFFRDRLGKRDYELDFGRSAKASYAHEAGGVSYPITATYEEKTQEAKQVVILSDGRYEVTPDLTGKIVSVLQPIRYPEVVMISGEPLDKVRLHLVYTHGKQLYHCNCQAGIPPRLSHHPLLSICLHPDFSTAELKELQ